ncbi:DUF488 family protein [Pseudomonas sihuiensis]|jgi:Protein of unknown function, DUF488|uniref:DUF488 domain-containing protein n=1 Tax=Pseudomonadota TaxID=1224 RepID=UPI001EDD1FDC|nr:MULTISPECIES: DUF488 domain-containing protein [Pseudomonadota]MDR5647933.1 DUF488 domain-containing protein [Burkholderia cenocepacia]
MKIFTIGFTKTSARSFFTKLNASGAKRLVDVRLNNVSQLAGFAKREDLRYFSEALCGMEYEHLPALAPTKDMFEAYKIKGGDWDIYARKAGEDPRRAHRNGTANVQINVCRLFSNSSIFPS